MGHPRFVILHDLVDPNDKQGRSYREVNAAKEHAIPLGSLVEMDTGVRLFVVLQTRDCDMTPLYALGKDMDDPYPCNGYDEGSLKVIKLP